MATLYVIAALLCILKPVAFAQESSVFFSYSGSTGPDRWGSLSPDYAKCSSGRSQSPINIVNGEAVINTNLKALDIQFRDSVSASLVSNGFNVLMRFDGDAGKLVFGGKNYALKQMHWHTSSEHRVDGTQYTGEVHLVHNAADSSVAVVSVLLQSGQSDPIIAKVQQQLDKLPSKKSNESPPEIALGNVNIQELSGLTNTDKYYTFTGSLTTPPCTEGVTWIVIGKIGSISNGQIAALKRPMDDGSKTNARPVQAINGRNVEAYQA
ncbi:alpha carbonic anhydrase 1, chloroplastic-like [Ipomoea triloba]|uniref:alpha carbonic anhydrase 1, chloroplastic-like n=1 Tax=Ipomoea triloba TaxID=35885 RepID=UPI00125E7A3B|nr:alpha carbonic anhydrase 1, chloroplastic-like [Ipomoea triloba]